MDARNRNRLRKALDYSFAQPEQSDFSSCMTFWPFLFTLAASCVNYIEACLFQPVSIGTTMGGKMSMLPYPPPTQPDAAGNSLLRVLGGILAFLSIMLTLLSMIFHQHVADLVLAIIVGMFAVRVLILWLRDTPPRQQPLPSRSSMNAVRYRAQSPLPPPGQPAPYAASHSQSLHQLAPEQHMQQTVPLPTAEAARPSPTLPRSVRPQRPPNGPASPAQPAPLPQGAQPLSPPLSLRLPPPHAALPLPSLAPLPNPSQQGHWQFDSGNHFTQQQKGNDHGTA